MFPVARMVFIQFPNRYLITMLGAWLASNFLKGQLYFFSRTIFYVAGVIWSYEEIAHGINIFRKSLGIIVMLILIMGLWRALSH